MKRKYVLLLAVCFLASSFLGSCGGNGPGSPGSQGTEDIGVAVDVPSISFSGNASSDIQSSNVDAFQEICSSGKAEPFRDHPALVTFVARLLNPNTTFVPGRLHVEKYTIVYSRKNDSLGSPPIETFVGNQRVDIVPPTGSGTTTVTTSLMFVDLRRKDKYANDMLFVTPDTFSSENGCSIVDIGGGSFAIKGGCLNNYTATYTFEGQNDFGQHFSFTGRTDFSIGDFINCP